MQRDRAYAEPYSRHFDPNTSRNPFVNGASFYRFVLGDPLCVLCGKTGHLNRECTALGTNEELSPDEQKFLWRLVMDAQNRMKAERGLQITQPTMALAPGNETLERAPVRSARSRRKGEEDSDSRSGGFREYRRPYGEPQRCNPSRENASRGYAAVEEFPRHHQRIELLPDRRLSREYSPEVHLRRQGFFDERYPRERQFRERTSADSPHAERPPTRLSPTGYPPTGYPTRELFHSDHRMQQGEDYSDYRRGSGTAPRYERLHERSDWVPNAELESRKRKFDEVLPPRSESGWAWEDDRRKREGEHQSQDRGSEVKVERAGPPANAYITSDVPAMGKDETGKTTTTAPSVAVPDSPVPTLDPISLGMGAAKRMSNGELKIVGPHPSTIRVSAPYITQSAVEKRLQPPGLDAQERNLAAAREDQFCLQGVTWLDNVRRALQLPIKTYTTACVYYHKFRLAHPTSEYSWSDAAAASLLTSCKNEDTLKKSKDILAAAYNMKQSSSHEQVGSDDPMFDGPSRAVVGVERLILESGAFDFRSRSPHQVLVKISKSLPPSEDLRAVAQLAWTVLTDLHRTFAPLKHTSATLSLASLELAVHFYTITSEDKTCSVRDDLQALNFGKWYTTRAEVMETLLDALDLYTHHTTATILGPKYTLDDLLRIRLALNKECSEANLPRHTSVQPPTSPDNTNGTANTLRVANGHPTPVSPPQPGTQPPQQPAPGPFQAVPEGGGTLRFMLNPQRAVDERAEVNRYHVEEWEEYEEEIEVPLPRNRSRDRSDRHRLPDRPDRERDGRSREFDDRRSDREGSSRPAPPVGRELERERLRIREREAERERTRLRERERDGRRFDDRRGDEGFGPGPGHGHGHGHGHRGRDRRFEDRPPYDAERRRGPRDNRR